MSRFASNLFTAYNNLHYLLENRDYDTSKTANISIQEVEEKYKSNTLNAVYVSNIDSNDKLYVYYCLDINLRENVLEEILDTVYIEEHQIETTDTLVIVIKDDLNDTMEETIRKKLKLEWESNKKMIILLTMNRLQINILKHIMVPKHTILNQQSVDEVKSQFNVTSDTEFPEISRFDPVAKVIFMRPGQICKIERMSKTALLSYYYRICLNQ
jgi:DNA-directed RNA polymerase subunit H (RpoH/RPB5)